MKHRIDPLIAERAPWLFNGALTSRAALAGLERLLGYGRTVALAERFETMQTRRIMAEMGTMLAREVTASGLGHIPTHGPALIVANHPTGIADGIILHHLISQVRPDLFIYANSDILRVLPQMSELILPVEWRAENAPTQRHERRWPPPKPLCLKVVWG